MRRCGDCRSEIAARDDEESELITKDCKGGKGWNFENGLWAMVDCLEFCSQGGGCFTVLEEEGLVVGRECVSSSIVS